MDQQTNFVTSNGSNSNKSKAIIVILAILLIAVSGFAGYLWFTKSNQDSANREVNNTNSSSEAKPVDANTPESPAEYVSLPFMGVKYKKTANQKYVVTSIENVNGNMIAYFTSSAHADVCGTKEMHMGAIERSKEKPENNSSKKIGDYWYSMTSPQAYNCDDTSVKYNEWKIVQDEIFTTLEAE